MAEIVNLRQARKAKVRAGKAQQAETNRTVHGRTLSERASDAAAKRRAATALDQAKREL